MTESELEYGDIIILQPPPSPVPASAHKLPTAIESRMDARPASSPHLPVISPPPRRSVIMTAPHPHLEEEMSASAAATITAAQVAEAPVVLGPQTRSQTQAERGIAPSGGGPGWRRAEKVSCFLYTLLATPL